MCSRSGTIEPRKNYPVLVRAFDALATDDPEVRLVVAGKRGWGSDEFDAALDTRRATVTASARWATCRPTSGPTCSRAHRSSCSRRTTKASASHPRGHGHGHPGGGHPGGAVPEVVGDAARLVDPDDAAALADALHEVLTDDATRRDLVARGRARHDGFSWSQTVDELLDLYRAVPREGRRHRRAGLRRPSPQPAPGRVDVEVVSFDVGDSQPVDITDHDGVVRRIGDESPDVVYHLAARSHVGASWSDGDELTQVNVDGTRAVVDA